MERLIVQKIKLEAEAGDTNQITLANELLTRFQELTRGGLTDLSPTQAATVFQGESTGTTDLQTIFLSDQSRVLVGDRSVSLTKLENRVFSYFHVNPNRTIPREELLGEIWRNSRSAAVVEKAINRLRIKIEPDPGMPTRILSVRGQGYIYRDSGNTPLNTDTIVEE